MIETGIMTPRKKYLDAVKGCCILLVLFGHAGGIPHIGGVLFACYMQVYFVVAGMTYTDRKNETFRQFVGKKAKRLLLPYAVYATLFWLIDCTSRQLTIPEIMRGGGGILYARHCLFVYHGHQNNLFLLDNLNEQMWFLPAIFLSYILFWLIVKSDAKRRSAIIIIYLAINIGTSFLPILLPWSLDTVFITAVLMYCGFMMKPGLNYIERLDMKKVFRPKIGLTIILMSVVYIVCYKLCGGANTSVRIFGAYGALSIPLYMLLGVLGTLLFTVGFAVAENTNGLQKICNVFAYLGKNTMVFLAMHIAVFRIIESEILALHLELGYMQTLLDVCVATGIGILIGKVIEKLGQQNDWIRILR